MGDARGKKALMGRYMRADHAEGYVVTTLTTWVHLKDNQQRAGYSSTQPGSTDRFG
jgi:hypothetical protein